MIVHIMKEPLFTELRTRQQLGYIVSLTSDFYGRFAFVSSLALCCAWS
jgi:secreted Zn-dependent insulinase-like peptidase